MSASHVASRIWSSTSSHGTRPHQPSRTLSSSIRQYHQSDNYSRNSRSFASDPALTEADESSSSNRTYGTANSQAPRDAARQRQRHERTALLPNSSFGSANANILHAFAADGDDDDGIGSDEEAHDIPQADADGLYPPNCTWTSNVERPQRSDPFGNMNCNVWTRVHQIRREVINAIDDPYSLEQLKAPRMNLSIVRPLVDKYFNLGDLSIVYCLLANRVQFIREQSYATHHQTLNLTRALLCELLAERVLRRYNENNPGPIGLLKIANILVAGFEPFQGAPEEIIKDNPRASGWAHRKHGFRYENKMTALEIAIVSESKSLLSGTACQRVIDAIYRGKVVYSPNSFIDIIPDHWKRRPISLYDARRGPLLNQYRLIVPRTRNIIETFQYLVLLVLYLIVMTGRESWRTTKYDAMEVVFDFYAIGWVLDQLSSILEHGWSVYSQNLWSFLDVLFTIDFLIYFSLRMHGLRHDSAEHDMMWGRTALDVLSCAAPIMFPRLAFNVMSDNLLILSLRSMMVDFLTLTALAIWCFGGFLFSLKWLHNGAHGEYTIAKWMIWIWFGLDGTGIDKSPDFHWVLGPTLMITFAFLGNTLFLTILVSMLSNTFSTITTNAVQEIQYRRSVLTFLGVKSDAIFAYMPPFNILALLFLLPLKWVISPRSFHKLNVVISRVLNFPLLLLIGLYERRALWVPDRLRHYQPRRINWADPNGPRATDFAWWSRMFSFWNFSTFNAHSDVQAVFENEPPESWFEAHMGDTGTPPDNSNSTDQPPAMDGGNSGVVTSPPNEPQNPDHKSQKDLLKEEAIRKEFFDSEEELKKNHDHVGGHGKGHKKKQRKRKDSIIELEHPFMTASQETDSRLGKLELSIARIESLILRLLEDSDDDGGSATQQELRDDEEAERV